MDTSILQVLRELHGQNTSRIDQLGKDLNGGFDKIRTEMQIQNGRVSKNEGDIRVIGERLVPVQRAVYSVIGLMGAGFIGAVMALVFHK